MLHDSIWLTLAVAIVVKLVLVGMILYFLGGICFLFHRCRYPETEARLRDFLHQNYIRFARGMKRTESKVTPPVMRRMARRGWRFVPPIILIIGYNSHLSPWLNVVFNLIVVAYLSFGGLQFGYAWYGMRCLRLLNLASIEDGRPSLSVLPP